MTSKMLIAFSATVLLFGCASVGIAQTLRGFGGIQPLRPSTSIAKVNRALAMPIETKEFQEKIELGKFLEKLGDGISKKGKEIQIVIDDEAFMDAKRERLEFQFEEVILPPIGSKMIANTALRLVLSQVGEGKATYLLRSGQIVITSGERAESSYFVKNCVVEAKFKNRPLVDALDTLAEQSGVSIIVDGRVAKKARAEVTAKFGGKLDTAVRLLTASVGLKHVVVDNVIYVTSPENAEGFKHEKKPLGDIGLLAYKNRPLLDAIGDISGWVLDSRVKQKADIRVTVKWLNHVDADTAIRLLTDMAGLRHVVVDGVVYITDAANAKKLMEEESRKKPAK
jgi:hypothetical protein